VSKSAIAKFRRLSAVHWGCACVSAVFWSSKLLAGRSFPEQSRTGSKRVWETEPIVNLAFNRAIGKWVDRLCFSITGSSEKDCMAAES
jgi:hypothetical protein